MTKKNESALAKCTSHLTVKKTLNVSVSYCETNYLFNFAALFFESINLETAKTVSYCLTIN
jgi:hypothetical protein